MIQQQTRLKVLPTPIGDTFDVVDDIEYFVGFDGTKKTYEELTEEEKQDWEEQGRTWEDNLLELIENAKESTEKHGKKYDEER